jgi:hypothetical protein
MEAGRTTAMFASAWSWWRGRRRASKEALAPITADIATAIQMHEDDWGMKGLYPMAAKEELSAQLADAFGGGRENLHPSGIGWTRHYVVQTPSTTYVDAGLRLADAAAALARIMPRVRSLYIGIPQEGGRPEHDAAGHYDDDAWCFGYGSDCYIGLEVAGEHVRHIWFDLTRNAPDEVTALRTAMLAINRLMPSAIVDLRMAAMAPIDDRDLFDRYFARHAAEISAWEAWRRRATVEDGNG